jgi:hypothetical protein
VAGGDATAFLHDHLVADMTASTKSGKVAFGVIHRMAENASTGLKSWQTIITV